MQTYHPTTIGAFFYTIEPDGAIYVPRCFEAPASPSSLDDFREVDERAMTTEIRALYREQLLEHRRAFDAAVEAKLAMLDALDARDHGQLELAVAS